MGRPFFEAGDRIRTGDLNLGKVALYQLSYARKPPRCDAGRAKKGAGRETDSDGANLPNGRSLRRAQFVQGINIRLTASVLSWTYSLNDFSVFARVEM